MPLPRRPSVRCERKCIGLLNRFRTSPAAGLSVLYPYPRDANPKVQLPPPVFVPAAPLISHGRFCARPRAANVSAAALANTNAPGPPRRKYQCATPVLRPAQRRRDSDAPLPTRTALHDPSRDADAPSPAAAFVPAPAAALRVANAPSPATVLAPTPTAAYLSARKYRPSTSGTSGGGAIAASVSYMSNRNRLRPTPCASVVSLTSDAASATAALFDDFSGLIIISNPLKR
ncbi:hypothetical protein B0H19DRAFT_1275452 [Mycena capillaripes]|nr:hypothetical protein B0H19DRAFT_1275452 [Mycena capillaripes]